MRLLNGLLYCATATVALTAGISGAQAQDATGDAANDMPNIVVTGTRIKRVDLESNSPQTVLNSQELTFQGATTIEGALNRLPQFTPDANEFVSNGATGTSNVNLRNLGPDRTLLLIDGRRILPQQAIDLNFVPTALIDRVDVMTGGASAVYGSDALSGVVNFILRKDLDGIRVDAQTSFVQHSNNNDELRSLHEGRGFATAPRHVTDGARNDVNVAVGKNFADGRANITLYGGYRHFDPVLWSSRDVSACALNRANDEGTALACGGSSNSQYGSFYLLDGPNSGAFLSNAADGSKTFVPYDSSFAYNYGPTNYFQRSDERITAGGFAHYEVSPAADLYGSVMYMDDHTFSQAAPSAIWLGTNFAIPCNHPLASQQQLQTLCGANAGTNTYAHTLVGYRMAFAPRRDDLRHKDYRYSAGVRGDLGGGFSYDLNYLYSLARMSETYSNDVNQAKAALALDAVLVNGVPTCRAKVSGLDPDCVPVNVFAANGVTEEQAKYLFAPTSTNSRNTQSVYSFNITGDLGEHGIIIPGASRGVGVAFGAERRRETLDFNADAIAQQNGTLESDGVIAVNEVYGEIEVPLAEDQPFLQSLVFNTGVRYSAYTNTQESTSSKSKFNAWTYKAELSWQPHDDLRLRASYNHAIRAPNIAELFAGQSVGNVAAQDPCSGSSPSASQSTCAATGVTQAQYGHLPPCPADVCSAQFGGNPAVKPETADTYTFGVVITPQTIRNLSLTVDYYSIKVKDYIGYLDPSIVISQCSITGDPYYCGLFHRDPSSGALFGNNGYIQATTLNTGYLKTSGLDVNADYTFDVGSLGRVNFNMVGTLLLEQISQPLPGEGTYDCKGYFGYTCGQPSPEWRHIARVTLMTNHDTNVSLAWRYMGGTKLSALSANEYLSAGGSVVQVNREIKAYSYFDLAVTQKIADKLTLRAGANNLLDKSPPAFDAGVLASFGNGNTYPGVYDVLGRTIFVGATIEF